VEGETKRQIPKQNKVRMFAFMQKYQRI